MNTTSKKLAIWAFIVALVVTPFVLLTTVGAAVSGFEALNPGHEGMSLVYPVSDETVRVIKYTLLWLFSPLSVLVLIISIVNVVKKVDDRLSWPILGLCALMIAMMIFANWALDARFAPEQSSGSQQGDGELKIHQVNF